MNNHQLLKVFSPLFISLALANLLVADDSVNVEAATDDVGLDLQVVGDLFESSEDLESFERTLNDPENGYINLDLNGDGQVDFIQVIEEGDEVSRTITLQAILGENEVQEVAYIEIEKTGDQNVLFQIVGAADLYGPNIYFKPIAASIHLWPISLHLFKPGYRCYRSLWKWNHYPRWWRSVVVVKPPAYRNRIAKFAKSHRFVRTQYPVIRSRKLKAHGPKAIKVGPKPAKKPKPGKKVKPRKP